MTPALALISRLRSRSACALVQRADPCSAALRQRKGHSHPGSIDRVGFRGRQPFIPLAGSTILSRTLLCLMTNSVAWCSTLERDRRFRAIAALRARKEVYWCQRYRLGSAPENHQTFLSKACLFVDRSLPGTQAHRLAGQAGGIRGFHRRFRTSGVALAPALHADDRSRS